MKNIQTKIFKIKAKPILSFVMVLIISAMGISASAQSFVLDLEANPMSFTNADKTILVDMGNNGENAGSKHKYGNIITKDGITVYGILTILETNDAWITNFDDDAITGDQDRFQPRIGTNGSNGGYILYELEFFDQATDAELFLTGYYMTGVDIDGGSGSYNREYVQVGGYSSYQLDATTLLTTSTHPASGRTQFTGRQGSLSGVTFENTACFITNFTNANNKITFALGQTKANNERYYSVRFGAPDGAFSNPNVINNPVPVAIDDIGTTINSVSGGVSVSNVLDNDIFDGNPVIPVDVTISLVTPASNGGVTLNTGTGEVAVAPGTPVGSYQMTYRICLVSNPSSCDIANILVDVIVIEADLQITKTVTPNPVQAGQAVLYTITVLNAGPSDAENVEVEDILVDEFSSVNITAATGTSWTAPEWDIGDLANNESVELLIVATVKETFSGALDNTASVTSTTTDPDNSNNSATASTVVTPTAPVFNQYPANGPGTLAFEDLWPGKGDYDFNDLVIDYRFDITTTVANMVDHVKATFTIKAFGASMENGFGFQLSEAIDPGDLTVTGYHITESYISLSANGTEDAQSKPTIIVFDNAFNEMTHHGTGIGVNTTPEAAYNAPITIVVEIEFPTGIYSFNDLDITNFNPFLIADQTRGIEVHLPNYAPTDLANTALFGTFDDTSNPTSDRYYKTYDNLPWAINIYEQFDYPKEKANIVEAHLKFAPWATSGGEDYADWYKDIAGYRNQSLIYTIPNGK
jgi:LruC domain-containing protein/uncharacterized repeat protein (TIGR01451 family)